MYVDLESLCNDMHITNVVEIISVIRSEILTKTGCNASVGIGKLELLFLKKVVVIIILLSANITATLLLSYELFYSMYLKCYSIL